MKSMLSKVDCIQLPVPDLEAALRFYRDQLGHELIWRTPESIGLRLSESGTELVLQNVRSEPEVDWLVDSVEDALERFITAGGTIEIAPFDIPIGRCVIVRDPWGNRLVLLDMSKGELVTDDNGNMVDRVVSDGCMKK